MRSSTIILSVSILLITADLIGIANLLSPPLQPLTGDATLSPIPPEIKPRLHQLLKEQKYGTLEEEVRMLLAQGSQSSELKRVYATALRLNGKNREAIVFYSLLIFEFPRNVDLRLDRARSYLMAKDFEKSRQDYEFVLERQNDNLEALEGLKELGRAAARE